MELIRLVPGVAKMFTERISSNLTLANPKFPRLSILTVAVVALSEHRRAVRDSPAVRQYLHTASPLACSQARRVNPKCIMRSSEATRAKRMPLVALLRAQ